jgi:hypothetical protein
MAAITAAFPCPGPLVRHAYGELDLARAGTDAQRRALGRISSLPRPWDPPSCPPALRNQVWAWLDQVAAWINHEYTWAPQGFIPSCWPAHPHIAHELAVVADLRRTAGYALGGDVLEDWHRCALPGFLDRAGARTGTCCGPAQHDHWPAAGRYREFGSERASQSRKELFVRDGAASLDRDAMAPPAPTSPPLMLINARRVGAATEQVPRPPQ